MTSDATRFILTTVGTSGDIFPFIGIGAALAKRGHEVMLLANEHFEDTAREEDLDFVPVGTKQEYRQAIENKDLWHPRRGLKVVMESLLPDLMQAYDVLETCQTPGPTVVLSHPFAFASRLAQEKYGLPCATLVLSTCLLRSLHRVPVMYGDRDLSKMARPLKSLMWALADKFHIDPAVTPTLNRVRQRLRLPSLKRPFNDWIFSPSLTVGLFPEWFAPPQPDWPEQLHLTGFPLFHTTRPVSETVTRFVETPSPPVVFTSGSASADLKHFYEIAYEVCRKIGRRGLFLADVAGHPDWMACDESQFLHASFAPLDKILPSCPALVHHGGIGTTGAALAAGTPQVIRPVAFDHFDHADRIEELGVGKRLLSRQFNPESLADTLTEVIHDPLVSQTCKERAEQIRYRDAINAICDLIENRFISDIYY